METVITGRTWKFGDRVNTDALYPGHALGKPPEYGASFVLESLRPGWSRMVQPGDIIVGGKDFGIGSSRPVATLLHHLGVGTVVAEEFSSLFFRNCLNHGFAAVTAPGVTELVEEGDVISVDIVNGRVANTRTGESVECERFPERLLEILHAGGLMPILEAQGYFPADEPEPSEANAHA